MDAPEKLPDRVSRQIALRRGLACLVLLFERVWPAAWPALGVLGLGAVAALLDLPRLLPPAWHAGALVVFVGLLGVLAWRGLARVRMPDAGQGERRLEQASGLAHRPLGLLADRLASAEDPLALALWQAHRARVLRQLGRLRVGLPHPGLARRDPRALRAGLVVALVAALVIAGPDAGSRLGRAVMPDFSVAVPAGPATQVQAWVTPPAYTRLAPMFLKPEGGTVSAPAGAKLVVNVTGVTAPPRLEFAAGAPEFRALDAGSFQVELTLEASGRLAVSGGDGRALASWDVQVQADRAPTADWAEEPGAAPRGMQSRLPWHVTDDYGVTGLEARLRLRERAEAPALVVPIPLGGRAPTDARGVSVQDLSAHPWAGLAVIAELTARDAPGQSGTSAAAEFVLPERRFENPAARMIIAVRKGLSLRPEDRAGAVNGLRPLLLAPEMFSADAGAWINLSAIVSALVRGRGEGLVEEVQARMWELALHLEEGGAERTARALEQARREAREALEQALREPENAERRAELERKLEELREAVRRHLQALAEQARREQTEIPPEAQRMDPREMDRLMREMEQAAREGREQAARERMAELERMLEELRQAQAGREAQEQRNAERRQRGRQQMGALQDMIGREGQLLDNSQQRAPQGNDLRPRRTPPQAQQPGANPEGARQQEQRMQQALRRALGELMQQFGDLTGKIPPALNEADQAMREAGEALARGRDGPAAQAQQRAIDALQRGGREMAQEMARQFGRQRAGEADEGDGEGDPFGSGFSLQDGHSNDDSPGQGQQPGRRRSGEQRDPLGRQMGRGTSGADVGDDVRVPDEMERMRAQQLQEELRRRGGERTRPQDELDYIERLLRRF